MLTVPSFSPGALFWASASSPEGKPKPATAGGARARDRAGAADPPRDSIQPTDGPSGAPGSRGPAAEGAQGPGPSPAGTCCGVCVRAEAYKARAGEGRAGAGGCCEFRNSGHVTPRWWLETDAGGSSGPTVLLQTGTLPPPQRESWCLDPYGRPGRTRGQLPARGLPSSPPGLVSTSFLMASINQPVTLRTW